MHTDTHANTSWCSLFVTCTGLFVSNQWFTTGEKKILTVNLLTSRGWKCCSIKSDLQHCVHTHVSPQRSQIFVCGMIKLTCTFMLVRKKVIFDESLCYQKRITVTSDMSIPIWTGDAHHIYIWDKWLLMTRLHVCISQISACMTPMRSDEQITFPNFCF